MRMIWRKKLCNSAELCENRLDKKQRRAAIASSPFFQASYRFSYTRHLDAVRSFLEKFFLISTTHTVGAPRQYRLSCPSAPMQIRERSRDPANYLKFSIDLSISENEVFFTMRKWSFRITNNTDIVSTS